jgi:hypothetical protein
MCQVNNRLGMTRRCFLQPGSGSSACECQAQVDLPPVAGTVLIAALDVIIALLRMKSANNDRDRNPNETVDWQNHLPRPHRGAGKI